jgi:hypothetical protein
MRAQKSNMMYVLVLFSRDSQPRYLGVNLYLGAPLLSTK